MNKLARVVPAITTLSLGFCLAFGCASKDQGTTAKPNDAGKTDTGSRPAAKVPSTPPAPPKATATATSKPSGTTTAPPSPPPTDVAVKPLADPAQLAMAEGLEIDATCPAGISEGKGFCHGDTDYLVGCSGGKFRALNCDLFNTPDLAAFCDDSEKAGCFGIALTAVNSADLESAKSGKALEGASCKPEQEGKGFCIDTSFYACAGGKVYGYDCAAAYSAGFTCRAPSFESSIGCWTTE